MEEDEELACLQVLEIIIVCIEFFLCSNSTIPNWNYQMMKTYWIDRHEKKSSSWKGEHFNKGKVLLIEIEKLYLEHVFHFNFIVRLPFWVLVRLEEKRTRSRASSEGRKVVRRNQRMTLNIFEIAMRLSLKLERERDVNIDDEMRKLVGMYFVYLWQYISN